MAQRIRHGLSFGMQPPLSMNHTGQFAQDRQRLVFRQIKVRRSVDCQFQAGDLRRTIDGKHLVTQVGQLRHDVLDWRQHITLATRPQHAVVFEVVVAVVDEQVEHHAPEQFFQVGTGPQAEATDDASELDIATLARLVGNIEQGARREKMQTLAGIFAKAIKTAR